jgi:hypothetical protein
MLARLLKAGGTNVEIGKRLETIVNMLFRILHHFENGDITEPIY